MNQPCPFVGEYDDIEPLRSHFEQLKPTQDLTGTQSK